MKTRLSFFVFLTCLVGFVFSIDVHVLEDYFEQEKYDELEKVLASPSHLVPNDPSIIFFRGFLHHNPDSAAACYMRVVNDFPKSKYTDFALYRLGQYFYFENNYVAARRSFSRLLRSHPQSDLRDDAQYLYCQCVMAQGKADSAKLFLKAFVQNAPRSPFIDAAILDLENLGGLPLDVLSQANQKIKTVFYTIQVASYSNMSDAQNAMHKLTRVFSYVQVGERTLGNTTYYNVLVGRFDSKDKALTYAKLYIEPHLKEYKVVELNL